MRILILALALALSGAPALAETFESQQARFKLTKVADGLNRPWSMAWLPDGDALIALRPGGLLRWSPGRGGLQEIEGLPRIAAFGQGGLFDVKPAPDFTDTGRLAMAYSISGNGGAATRVSEAYLKGDRLTGVNRLFEAAPRSNSGIHFGGRLRFDPQGRLFATFGDRGDRERAQDASDPAGSVWQIEPGTPRPFTIGHRNPQGLAIHPRTGAVWLHEHGPRGGDEVNRLAEGANYGWPRVTFGREYSGEEIASSGTGPGYESPLHYWVPSIAPSGMAFYWGDAFPEWRGDLFVGALRSRLLVRLEIDNGKIVGEERLLEGKIGRIREVSVGPDGRIYLLTDARNGGLYRLDPA